MLNCFARRPSVASDMMRIIAGRKNKNKYLQAGTVWKKGLTKQGRFATFTRVKVRPCENCLPLAGEMGVDLMPVSLGGFKSVT